jgi:hypothetical protein
MANGSRRRTPSLEGFARLGSSVDSDPAKRKALREKIYALNGGNRNVDPGKLAVIISMKARAEGARAPIPVVRKFLEDLFSDDDR